MKYLSKDNIEFEVLPEIVELSEVFCDFKDDDSNCPLPFDSTVVTLMIQFCEMYIKEKMTEIEKPLISSNMSENVNQPFADFIDSMDLETTTLVIEIANFMNIQPLLKLGCAKVATMIRSKSPEEIRKIFNIDVSEEEENEIKKEFKWTQNLI